MTPTAATSTAAQATAALDVNRLASAFAARRSGGVRQPPTHSSSQCFAFHAVQRFPIAALSIETQQPIQP